MYWLGAKANEKLLARLVKAGISVIMIDRYVSEIATDYVTSDNARAAEEVVKCLVERGFHHVHYFTAGGLELSSVEDRIKGYKNAVDDLGLQCNIHTIGLDLMTSVVMNQGNDLQAQVSEIIESIEGDFAIFADQSWMLEAIWRSIGCKDSLSGKIALASFDDFGTNISPNTLYVTVRQPLEEIGRRSVDIALQRSSGDYSSPRGVLIPSELIVIDGSNSTKSGEYIGAPTNTLKMH